MQPQYSPTSPKAKDMTGQRFGRLLVLDCAGSNDTGRLIWRCRCDCGQETVVSGKHLRRGQQSCGCLQREAARATRYKHGMSHTRVFKIWQGMIERCTNPHNPNYQQYGGRGITICEQWMASFETFYQDMGEPPTAKHTIDRIDNERGYAPENCRWATRLEQGRNTRKTPKITIDDLSLTATEWAEISGLSAKAITLRIRKGIPPKIAVFHPRQLGHPIKVSIHEAQTMIQGQLFHDP